MKSLVVPLIALLVVVCIWCLPAAARSDVVDRCMQAYDDLGPFSIKLNYSMSISVGQSHGTHSFDVDVWWSRDHMRVTTSAADVRLHPSGVFTHSSGYATVVTDIGQGIDYCVSPRGEITTRQAQCLHLLDLLLLTGIDEFGLIEEAEWDGVPVWILTATAPEPPITLTYYIDRTSHFLREAKVEVGAVERGTHIVWGVLVGSPQSGVPDGVFDLDSL